MATRVEPRSVPAVVVPSTDPGYSWWPRWAAPIEELGYILSEDGHPWRTIAGGLVFLLLLVAAVGLFALAAPMPL
jgi:hypothetical protein